MTEPRITPQQLEANIASEHYFTAYEGQLGAYKNNNDVRQEKQVGAWETRRSDEALKLLTFCVLVLKNGFTVTGESACVSPGSFNAEQGRKIAREKALSKIWTLMGYALKEELYGEK